VSFNNPYDARLHGISAVYQEFSLVPQLTVVDNLFLGRELLKNCFLNQKLMLKQARKSLEEMEFDINPMARVKDLTQAERQMVEIAKAFQERMSVLILDEPTASLTDKEVRRLFQLLRKLTSEGVGIIYITHRINELKRIGDRVTVLRDGKKVLALDMSVLDEQTLISSMTGREYKRIFPTITNTPGETILSVAKLFTASGLHDISLEVRAGEILGIAGLIGSGKSRLGQAIFGRDEITQGEIKFRGQSLDKITPARSIERGILYTPADRHKEGLLFCRSVKENMTLSSVPLFERHGFLDIKREMATVTENIKQMNIRAYGPSQIVRNLSGGNQQKVILSRGLTRDIKVFIFDEACCGIDVGAKHEIYLFLKEQAEQGIAIIFISSELQEILHLCHTVIVMHANTIHSTIPGSEATEEKILTCAFGFDYNGPDRCNGTVVRKNHLLPV